MSEVAAGMARREREWHEESVRKWWSDILLVFYDTMTTIYTN